MAMRNPNGYGSVIKLGGKRRNPFAVRVTVGWDIDEHNQEVKQKYKYIGYYPTRKEAMQVLAEYNAGMPIPDNRVRADYKTLNQVFEELLAYKTDEKSQNSVGEQSIIKLKQSHKKFAELHNKPIINITTEELQKVFDSHKNMSQSLVGFLKSYINQVYRYAIKKRYIEINLAETIDLYYRKETETLHKPFTVNEVNLLWDNVGKIENIETLLIMIYTGLRPSELLSTKTENIYLEEGYFVSGMKTSNGINRSIPICSKIAPILKFYYNSDNEYLITPKFETNSRTHNYISYTTYLTTIWTPIINQLNLKHTPHDCRHTFATFSNICGIDIGCLKQIMGHSLKRDLTQSVYIHRDIDFLKKEMEKFEIK